MSEIKKRSSRYPTCGRSPSRRLHPELFFSSRRPQLGDADKDTEQTVARATPLTPSSSSSIFSEEASLATQHDTDEDSSESSSADSDNDSSTIRASLLPPLRIFPLANMAASVQKFIAPPVFSASPEEDAVDWLERFELAATYNRWSDADQARNFVMYLEGPARKWFLVHTHPNHWDDLPARPDPTVPYYPTYRRLPESKLRQREQGNEEDVVAYFYDIINMCRIVNPTMSQEQQLQHLYRGLKPTLLQKIYHIQPASTMKFLDVAKLHAEASSLVNRKVLSQSLLAVTPDVPNSSAAASTKLVKELAGLLTGLQQTIEQLNHPQTAVSPQGLNASGAPIWNQSGRNRRTVEGRFICGNDFLRQFGHLHVDYTGEQAHVILGDLPSFALNFPEPPVRHTKLWSLERCIIPAFSVVPVLTTGDTQFPGVSLFTPSEKLLSTKSLSVGHAVLFNATRSLPVANLSAVPDWINKHSTLGTLQPYTDDVVVCDHPDSFDGANQVFSNDTLPLEKNMSETSLETSINPDLPPRIRRKPNLFMAGLIYLLLLKICNALPSKDGIIIRDTVIFKEQPSISISESSWTVVTDVLLHDAETAIAAVEDHLAKLSRVAHAHHMDGTKFEKDDVRTAWRDTTSFMTANKIDNQVRLMGRTLNDSKTRLATCALTLSGARRPKRGILDLGGSTLKWLFGVSTQADLQDLNSRIEALTNSDKTSYNISRRF
ncbi:Uncharacterized protein APZ42_023719 [Daphnia magna]|uniref:Retrotransposon gag domain-containing protein n=1 Tax=Daphnia magna TaxID=35525 RepID=A0A164UQD2_9CRUS|nr:Uncharacterized protein APZ42_023719 [Daphnia magna]